MVGAAASSSAKVTAWRARYGPIPDRDCQGWRRTSGHAREPTGAAPAAPPDQREDDRRPPGRRSSRCRSARSTGTSRRCRGAGVPDLRGGRARRRRPPRRRLPHPPHRASPPRRPRRWRCPGCPGAASELGPRHRPGRRPAQGRRRAAAGAAQPGRAHARALPPRRARAGSPARSRSPTWPRSRRAVWEEQRVEIRYRKRDGEVQRLLDPARPRAQGRRLVPRRAVRPHPLAAHVPGQPRRGRSRSLDERGRSGPTTSTSPRTGPRRGEAFLETLADESRCGCACAASRCGTSATCRSPRAAEAALETASRTRRRRLGRGHPRSSSTSTSAGYELLRFGGDLEVLEPARAARAHGRARPRQMVGAVRARVTA